MAEYKLKHTGEEIDEKLDKIDELSEEKVDVNKQTLTTTQKTQARKNIEAVSIEEVIDTLSGTESTNDGINLLESVEWIAGYPYANGSRNDYPDQLTNGEAYGLTKIQVEPNTTYKLKYVFTPNSQNAEPWWALVTFFSDNTKTRIVLPIDESLEDGNTITYIAYYTPAENVTSINISGRTNAWNGGQSATLDELSVIAEVVAPSVFFMSLASEEETVISAPRLLPLVSVEDNDKVMVVNDGKWSLQLKDSLYVNSNIKAVNHRGYCTEAPENTLSAYKLSKKKGFTYVECDVSFTSDGVAVLLHDSTVDRTSNGTGNIGNLTLEEVKTLDFGSWFDSSFAGETIPTLEEFIILCKRIGLHPYIELKSNVTETQASTLVGIVKRYDMQKNVTWISFNETSLANIKTVDSTARLGFVTDTVTEDNITSANSLKTDSNEVFIDVAHYVLTDDFVNSCVNNNLPLEVWTINNAISLANLDAYVSGYTSDNLLANVVLYNKYI